MNGIIGTRKKAASLPLFISYCDQTCINGLFDQASQLSKGKATKLQQFYLFCILRLNSCKLKNLILKDSNLFIFSF